MRLVNFPQLYSKVSKNIKFCIVLQLDNLKKKMTFRFWLKTFLRVWICYLIQINIHVYTCRLFWKKLTKKKKAWSKTFINFLWIIQIKNLFVLKLFVLYSFLLAKYKLLGFNMLFSQVFRKQKLTVDIVAKSFIISIQLQYKNNSKTD